MDTTTVTETAAAFVLHGARRPGRACDSDCVWTFLVTARTAKFVTQVGQTVQARMRVGVREHDGEEWASPFGPSRTSTRSTPGAR